jgi:signal transduction histidine kinase
MVWDIVLNQPMNQNKLFKITRIRLALCYVAVMGLILSLCGFGFYKAVFHAHALALDNEIESVAGTIHNSIELELSQPGILETSVQQLFPNLNMCTEAKCVQQKPDLKRHLISVISQKDGYYIRFFDISERLVATAGTNPDISTIFNKKTWQFIQDKQGNTYHQITIYLHTKNHQDWGYIQVGRSLEEFNSYLDTVKLTLALGLPIALLLITFASWWLSGLAMRPIYQSYRQIQQFTADVAHELRTPLAASGATVESALLMPQLDEQETRDILRTLHRQNQRLTILVTDLLLLARFDRQSLTLKHEQCCLNDVINDLIEEFAAMANAADVILKCDIQVEKPVFIVSDTDQIYRLVSNLIVNAIQYTSKGGRILVILNQNESYAVIMVQDTGIGIPDKELKRIFDRFYRVNNDRSRITGGSGLGLAIAQAIIEMHRGKLTVKSELGRGSTFMIQLPGSSLE